MTEAKISEPKKEIKPEYKELINRIRATYQKNGADLFHQPEDFGGPNPYHGKTKDGSLRLSFDYGAVQDLETPDGGITVLGDHGGVNYDSDKIMSDLKEDLGSDFNITVDRPKRNDAKLRETPHGEIEYQIQYSGPTWKLTPKGK
ncbi:hypothetical protein COU96_01520 [Candidatus Shapirobacteria bacterium CG10_big_fil_rev_8_21_14_0_10_38_14]|uniref:Uncharacterized protein n=1 Tax=Candidatus Shapirobacteria bacterium CG10_big_fil_rev_8_21_14_0_10_38_14 TaxID=1974483 RepID=A0A2M8L5N2_9BACT|nr:MAG: hypothetical protein COU96_01520 [Candidatus Shapirobacteria bacterium CG10_big_fil_rev_8_21_14_0_10_38_14]